MPRIQHKRGTSANLASVNPTPLAGELVWDSTENAIKIGDGTTAWTSLAYVTATPRSHVHDGGDITTGTVAYARLPVGSTSSTVCAGDDARLSDARSPTAHKSTHATGGSDALSPSDIGAAPAASPTFTGTVTVPGLTSTGVILADDAATTNSVVYSFDGDPNTGIGRGGADVLTVVTNGSERLRVRSDGNVGIGSAGGSNAGLWIQPTLSSASDRYGIYGRITGTTDSTSPIYTCSTFADMHSSASTSLAVNYQAIRPQLAAGASVTTAVGMLVQSSFTVATNNYGVQLSIGSGSGRWNIYADGTAANYFAGNVGIGSGRTAPASALDVNGVITVAATSGSAGSYAPSLTFSGDANTGFGQVSGQSDTASVFTAGHERVRVRSDGNVGVGYSGAATHRFGVSGDISGTGSNIIILGAGTAAAAATQVYAFYSSPSVGASASLSVLTHYSAVQGTVSGTVTAQTGYACGDLTAATNNYGFRSAVSSATGRWNFYAEGTAANYFAGNVGIGSGTTTPTAALDINANKIRLRTAKTPASASDTGNAGDICWDANYLYICIASGTWRRVAHSTW